MNRILVLILLVLAVQAIGWFFIGYYLRELSEWLT